MQIKHFRQKGRFIESLFDEYNHLLDTDSDNIEHPLSELFAKKTS